MKRARALKTRHILAIAGEKEVKDDSADRLQRVAQLEQQLKQANSGGARSVPNSSSKPSLRHGRGRRSAGQDTTASAAAQERSLIRRLTRATTVRSSVIGNGIALSVKIDRGKKWRRSSPF